jgi:hypothetical protein
MATWTIISGTGVGTQLIGSKIVKTVRNGVVTYQFVGRLAGENPPATNTTAPNLTNVPFNQSTWNISSATAPPTWSGTCNNTTTPTGADGTWQAQSGGGGDDEFGSKGKSKKSAKATSKKSVKGTGKKSASAAKSVSKKSAKSTKGTKGAKGAKKTRGRG